MSAWCRTTASARCSLKGHFHHFPYDTLDALINKINRYSSDAAASMYAKGRRTSIFGALGHSFWTFVRIYLIRRASWTAATAWCWPSPPRRAASTAIRS